MQRMSGYDAQFVYDECPEEPQHTLKLAILDPKASAAYSREGLAGTKRWLRERLPQVPPLRWRAQRIPFDLSHPLWLEDTPLDLDRHVHHLALPAPGGHAELCEVVSDLLGQPLDPERPPWELWVLEGLEGGRIAYAFKISHALGDGGASCAIMQRLFAAPDDEAPAQLPREARPTAVALMGSAVVDAIRELVKEVPPLVAAAGHALVQHREHDPESHPHRPPLTRLRSPWTPFGGPLRRGRGFDFVTVSFAEAREIARAFGCTIGDVVLATAAGGVRGYLFERGELPGLPTLGHMAVSVRSDSDPTTWGNRVAARPLALPTQLADPVARLRACSRAASRAKAEVAGLGVARIEEWQRRLPPGFTKALARLARTAVRLHTDLTGGVMVSNMRGPTLPLVAPGGTVERFVSVGHMKYAAGLNTTIWSYAGELNFAFYASADAVPDLSRMARHLIAAFEELQKAAAREAARVPARIEEQAT